MQHSVAHSKCCKDEQMRDSFSWSSAPGTEFKETAEAFIDERGAFLPCQLRAKML